ncbi:MAG: hypothetical protein NZ839_04635 [Endomicrobia bacterium]|nr:hypothetical protein [Endomicrobiia bacterium]
MQNKNILENIISKLFKWLYLIISLLVVIYIVWFLFKVVYNIIFIGEVNIEQQIFSFLSTVILIIVGVELGELVYARDYRLLMDILIFAIARKIIIKPEFTLEYAIAYLALIVFMLIKKFIFTETVEKQNI